MVNDYAVANKTCKCPHCCVYWLNEAVQYCGYCGYKLPKEAQSYMRGGEKPHSPDHRSFEWIFCISNYNYCPYCGKDFHKTKAPT